MLDHFVQCLHLGAVTRLAKRDTNILLVKIDVARM